jgi:cytoskeletal protein CcmA (bactofilin family)
MPSAEQNNVLGASVIGADIVISGHIQASVDLHIEGRVNGDVSCATLLMGENSFISGTVRAERVRISGVVEGAIDATDVAIEGSGRVTADVSYSRLRVSNGAAIVGQLKCKPSTEANAETGKLKLVEPEQQAQIK